MVVDDSTEPTPPPILGPPSRALAEYAGYPRQAVETELKRSVRLARGFVIGNYWAGCPVGVIALIAIAGGALRDHRPVHKDQSITGLLIVAGMFFILFLLGFVIGSSSRRKKVSVILGIPASFFSGVIWLVPLSVSRPGTATLLLFVYTILGTVAAAVVNRAVKRIASSKMQA